jgi:outer membrane protein assembly factor BamB
MRMATRVPWILVTLAVSLLGASASADNWPTWRGPSSTGVSSEARLPQSWSDTENIAWRARLTGVGVSSPVVWGDRVFVTSQVGSGVSREGPRLGQGSDASPTERALGSGATAWPAVRFLVEAFGCANGQRAWTFELAAEGNLPAVHEKHNLASASPVVDGERVYAVFGSGQVVAVDMTGQRVWSRNLAKEFAPFEINWGPASSPTLYRGALIVVCYHETASYLLALDARTGRQRWKTDRPKGVLSYSTPIVVPGPNGGELIVNSTAGIEAYDPATGAALWQFDEPIRMAIPVAMYDNGVIYLSRGYRSGPYMAIRPGGRGEISKTHVVWRVPTGAPYVSSLLYYDGLLYMAGDTGIITCVDAKTGEPVWRQRLGGIYTASPVAGDGKIYLFAESGETVVLRAGRTPDVLVRNTINGRILASPAISGGRIFIRTDDAVIAVSRSAGGR